MALESKDLARVVEAFAVVGPRNLSALARNSGVPRDTCRYIRDRLIELGVEFRASVDYSRIGLSRYLVLMDFHKETFPHGYRESIGITGTRP